MSTDRYGLLFCSISSRSPLTLLPAAFLWMVVEFLFLVVPRTLLAPRGRVPSLLRLLLSLLLFLPMTLPRTRARTLLLWPLPVRSLWFPLIGVRRVSLLTNASLRRFLFLPNSTSASIVWSWQRTARMWPALRHWILFLRYVFFRHDDSSRRRRRRRYFVGLFVMGPLEGRCYRQL